MRSRTLVLTGGNVLVKRATLLPSAHSSSQSVPSARRHSRRGTSSTRSTPRRRSTSMPSRRVRRSRQRTAAARRSLACGFQANGSARGRCPGDPREPSALDSPPLQGVIAASAAGGSGGGARPGRGRKERGMTSAALAGEMSHPLDSNVDSLAMAALHTHCIAEATKNRRINE